MILPQTNSDRFLFTRRLLRGGSAAVLSLSLMGAVASAQEAPAESVDDGDTVIATGIRQSLETAAAIKRNADSFVDAITAEDIGALPDRSVSEALQRVPGVSVLRFSGPDDPDHFSVEGDGVVIRGLPFVRSELNGRDAFAASPSGTLGFNDVSPELLGSVEVFKNQSADMIEGGLSGTIDLNTRKPFDQDSGFFGYSLDFTYSDLVEKVSPSFSVLGSKRWETSAGEFGLLAGFSRNRLKSRSDASQTGDFRAYDADDNMINSDITDNSGNYKIDYLGQDDYYLRFTPPSNTGYGPTIPNQGNDDSVDSDIDGSNGPNTTSLISLNSGDDLPTVDAGLTFGVVPVEWLSFTGVSRENFNKLDWSTASERNVSHFEIERSLHNTVGFVSIGKIVAVGNSSEVSNYKMRDYDVEKKGAYYYRLKQVDYNGYHEYSNTIRIERKGVRNNGIDLYPNPTIEEFTIDLNVAKQSKVHISIWDAAGKLVGNNEINKVIEEGNYRRTIDVSTLPAGIYNVKVTIENTVYNKKLLIVH